MQSLPAHADWRKAGPLNIKQNRTSESLPVQILVVRDDDGAGWLFRAEGRQIVLRRVGTDGNPLGDLRPTIVREYEGAAGKKYALGSLNWPLTDAAGILASEKLPVLFAFNAQGELVSVEMTEPIKHVRVLYEFRHGLIQSLTRSYPMAPDTLNGLMSCSWEFDAQGAKVAREDWMLEDGKQVHMVWAVDSKQSSQPVLREKTVYDADGMKEQSVCAVNSGAAGKTVVNISSEYDGPEQISVVHCAGLLFSKTVHSTDGLPAASIEYAAGQMKSYTFRSSELKLDGARIARLTKEPDLQGDERLVEATITVRTELNGESQTSVQNALGQTMVLKRKACGTAVYFKNALGEWTSADEQVWSGAAADGQQIQLRGCITIAPDGTLIDGRGAGGIRVERTDGTVDRISLPVA